MYLGNRIVKFRKSEIYWRVPGVWHGRMGWGNGDLMFNGERASSLGKIKEDVRDCTIMSMYLVPMK